MAAQDFEKFFLHFPSLDREKDFIKFWERGISDLKKIPIKPEIHENIKKSSERFTVYHINYYGHQKSQAAGELLVPKIVKKPMPIIHIHDYNNKSKYRQDSLDIRFAHFFLTLRGHANLPAMDNKEKEAQSPGYMAEHILDIDAYYAKGAFLDVYRSIDLLRLNPEIECGRIGIIGKGFGAAAALFTAAFSNRIYSLVLETPSFCHLKLSQNISTSDFTREINDFIELKKTKKKEVKVNLSYFDGVNFSDMIKSPVLVTVGLKDTISPPECVFALFNRFETEKTVEVYPEEGNSAGGHLQMKKSMNWLTEKIYSRTEISP